MLKSTHGLPMQIPKIYILFISEKHVIRYVWLSSIWYLKSMVLKAPL
jgi:hypothetical protein